ncbi:MAG: hypothetical protein ACKO3F_08860, partial [Cyanobium sp.]
TRSRPPAATMTTERWANAGGDRRAGSGNAAAWATAAEDKLMGYRANERGKLSEDYRFIQVPQAMGSWPLAQLLFYQYKRTKQRAEWLRGNGSMQSKASR